jgi:CheY-like chemotaxis protein
MRKKILVIDDSVLLQRFHETALKAYDRCDVQVLLASDGQEGLTRLHEHADIDLILLDINMPGMTGLEFLRRLRSDSVFHDSKVILQSTEDHQEDIQRGMEAGATAYLTKPFTVEKLYEILDEVLANVA